MRRIALTGATSTLGTAIIRQCILQKIEIVAFINRNSRNEARIPTDDLVTKEYCTLEEMKNLDVSNLHADVFIHLAWSLSNRRERNDPGSQLRNAEYAVDSVHLAKRMGCHTYIGAGSQAEYGIHNTALTEETYPAPVTAYGIAKLCAGQMTRLACSQLGLRHIWPRILSTYGPNTQDTTIINYTLNCLIHGQRPSLSGCEQMWDFIYVDDAAKALLMLAEKGKSGEVYNISSGICRPMKEYIQMLCTEFGSNISIGYGDLPYGPNTVMHLEGDISKIRREIGFEPSVSFEEGIKKTIEWAKEYYIT